MTRQGAVSQRGGLLIEVLVTVFVSAFALLGFAAIGADAPHLARTGAAG